MSSNSAGAMNIALGDNPSPGTSGDVLTERLAIIRAAMGWVEKRAGYPICIKLDTFGTGHERHFIPSVCPKAALTGLLKASASLEKLASAPPRQMADIATLDIHDLDLESVHLSMRAVEAGARSMKAMNMDGPVSCTVHDRQGLSGTVALLSVREALELLTVAGRDLVIRWQKLSRPQQENGTA